MTSDWYKERWREKAQNMLVWQWRKLSEIFNPVSREYKKDIDNEKSNIEYDEGKKVKTIIYNSSF